MPVPDTTDNPNDWQTQLMNFLRGTGGNPVMPNIGATMPNDPRTQDQALPGGRSAWPAVTPGAPSMGYPALNQGGNPQAWPPVGPTATPAAAPAGTATAAPAAPRSVAPAPVAHVPNLGYGVPGNPRFGTMQSQIPSGRGPLGNNPIYTTMNLFGGGQQPAAGAAAAPAPAPAAAPLVGYSPGMHDLTPGRTEMTPTALASAVNQPNWWQNLGRPDMTPAALASAVRKPNWWQNI